MINIIIINIVIIIIIITIVIIIKLFRENAKWRISLIRTIHMPISTAVRSVYYYLNWRRVLKDDRSKGSRVLVISRCFSLKFGSNEKEGITFPCDDDYDRSRQLYCASHCEYFHSRSVGGCVELKENGLFGEQTCETFPFSFQSFVMYSKLISKKRYFFSSLTQEAKGKLLKNVQKLQILCNVSFSIRWACHIQWTCLQACARWLTEDGTWDKMRRKYVVVGLHTVWQTWTSVALPKFFDRSFASFSLFSQILTFYKQIYIYFQEVS